MREAEGAPRGPVVVLTGPTAAGKSALALELAERFGAEILNADSMQVYRFMDVGTGKPSLAERQRVPHHLFDVVTPKEHYDAARYGRDARRAADAVLAAGRVPFLVGGTGLYIRAFLGGLLDGGGADPERREALEREHERAVRAGEANRLHERLAGLDPEAAARIHPNDVRRVIRALELVGRGEGRVSERRRAHGFADRPYRVLHLALDREREALDARIDARCRRMIEGGLLQEVRDLRERGYGPELRPMRSIGYRHMQPVVEGSDTLVNAQAAMQRDTRRFARRQRTWLRGVPEARWLDAGDHDAVAASVEAFLADPDAGRVRSGAAER